MDESSPLGDEAARLLRNMQLVPPREPGESLRSIDEAAILELARLGWTQERIAAEIGCHQSTVSRTIAEYDDTRPLARKLLESRALEMAKRLIDGAKPETILRIMGKLDVVRDDDAGRTQVGVQIIQGAPGYPASDPVTVTVQRVVAANVDDNT